MRDLYKILDTLIADKVMVRFNSFPGGSINVSIHVFKPKELNYLYDADSIDEIEKKIVTDFRHLIVPVSFSIPTGHPSKMPTPPGFPRP
jgi:hypothetical protein